MPQNGPYPWVLKRFGDRNIAQGGCSLACLAMVISFLNSGTDKKGWITPGTVHRSIVRRYGTPNKFYAPGIGQYWSIFPAVSELFGYSCEEIAPEKTEEELLALHPLIVSCRKGTFTNGGHFIVLTGIRDGQVYVNDPTFSHRSFSYKTYPLELILNERKNAWRIF